MELFWTVMTIVSLPLQFMQLAVYTLGNFIIFDALRLGPYLPITF